MTKIWREWPGFEGLYEVSSEGDVRSVDRVVVSPARSPQRLKGRVLRPGVAFTGYRTVALSRDGKPRSYTIHELVAAAFIGPRQPGDDVDHIDGNRLNNHVQNLRYVPHEINTRNITKINSRSGALGVYPNGKSGWMAMVGVGGKTVYLGTYRTIAEASAARQAYESRTDHRGFGKIAPAQKA